jgi:hypothetical protein
MKTTLFQKLLFDTAIVSCTVDGTVSQDEINVIKNIAENTIFFDEFDWKIELEKVILIIKSNSNEFINSVLAEYENNTLNERQSLIIIDTIIQIILIDNNIEENEHRFLHLILSKLKISDEILISKFPLHFEFLIQKQDFFGNDTFNLSLV